MKKQLLYCFNSAKCCCSSPAKFWLGFVIACFVLAMPDHSFAQKQIVVTGVVKDAAGNAMEGVTVKLKESSKTTVTDALGKYKITVPSSESVLIFSYVGYANSQKQAKTNKLDIVLIETASVQNEVVVIGYGQVKRKELTGVVGKVNMDDVQKAPVASFDQALGGRIAGVVVSSNDGQPGSGSQIVIRGSTAGQDVSPLYVIDGFPIENMDINSINTNDIASIEVLKDASSISIYGARGANGVIIVTTKKGKAGPPKITYSFSEGLQNPIKLMNLLSPYEFVKLQLELDSIQSTATVKNVTGATRYLDPANGIDLNYYKNVKGYDWQRLLIQQGVLQTHNVGITGGNADTRYALSGSYTNQKGIIINTGLKKYDGKFSLDTKISDKLRTGISLNYSNTTSYGTIPTGTNSGGVIFNVWAFKPVDILGATSLETGLIDSTAIGTSGTFPDNLVNPLQQAQNEYRKNLTTTTTFNSYIEYTLIPDLKFKITGGINATTLRSEAFYNSKTSQGTLATNVLGVLYNPTNQINGRIVNTSNANYITESTLSYRKRKDRNHILDAVAGFTYQYGRTEGNGFSSIQIPQSAEYLGILALGSGTATSPSNSASHNQMYSFLGRANYSWMEKYIFTVTGRYDGSSKFAPGNQWGFFPSGAFAWRFTQEPFMRKTASVLTDGKFHVSYGAVGNNRVSDFSYSYQFGSLTSSGGYPLNNTNILGTIPFFYGNPNITWETTRELDLGLSLSLWRDKITIDMDYYNKNTSNSLLGVPISSIGGYATGSNAQYQNVGVIQNRGFELTVNTTNIQTKKFTWTSSFNISFNRNKILSFYNGIDLRQTSWNLNGAATAWVAKVGNPISQFFGYKWGGVYQYADFNQMANGAYILKPTVASYVPTGTTTIQPGDPKYVDLNGDGVVDDNDRAIIGNPLPIHTGGLSNNFTYNAFSLNVFFQWSYGNQVLNANKQVFESGGFYANSNQFASFTNRWTPTNPTNDIPRARQFNTDPGGQTRVSSRLVEDASFLRLKTVALGYNLSAFIAKKIHVTSIKLFVAAQNLITFTKYSGLDPEVSTYRAANPANAPSGVTGQNATGGVGYLYIQPSSGSAALAQGFDYTPYPRTMTVTFGANVTF